VTPYAGIGYKPANVSLLFNYNPQQGTTFFTLNKWF
jgi:hypothetical protein